MPRSTTSIRGGLASWRIPAGGGLACLLGMASPEDGLEGNGGDLKQSSEVHAVVAYAPPTDLARLYRECASPNGKVFFLVQGWVDAGQPGAASGRRRLGQAGVVRGGLGRQVAEEVLQRALSAFPGSDLPAGRRSFGRGFNGRPNHLPGLRNKALDPSGVGRIDCSLLVREAIYGSAPRQTRPAHKRRPP
jgi:hypothetical protein